MSRAAEARKRRAHDDRGTSLALVVVVAFALAPLLDGCTSRRVVMDPERVLYASDHAWKITSEPGHAAPSPSATTPPSVTPTAGVQPP